MRFILSKSSQPCIMCGKLTIHKYESEGEVV